MKRNGRHTPRRRSSWILRPPFSGRQGFTLIEILTATAMFAVLIGAVSTAFYSAFRLREKAYERFESALPRSQYTAVIRRDLESIVPPVGLLAGAMIGEKKESGNVRRDQLEFHTASGNLGVTLPWADIQRVEYTLEAPAGIRSGTRTTAYDLVRSVSRNLLSSTEEDPEQEVLMEGVQSLAFSYYDGEDWVDSWDSTTEENETPTAVRVTIEFAPPEDGGLAEPPIELVVPIIAQPVPAPEDQATGSATGSSDEGPTGGSGGPGGNPPQGGPGGGGGR